MSQPVCANRQRVDHFRTERMRVVDAEYIPVVLVAVEILSAGKRVRQSTPVERVFWIGIVSVGEMLAIPGPCEREAIGDTEVLIELRDIGVLDAGLGLRSRRDVVTHKTACVRGGIIRGNGP